MLSDRLVDVHSLRQSVCPLCKIQGAAMHGPTVGRMLLINASVLVACRKRKCADTTGTVPIPWAGHFQPMLKYKYIVQMKYMETTSSNSTLKQLWFEVTKMLVVVVKNNLMCYLLQFLAHFCSL